MQRNARTCIIAQYNRDTHAFIRRRVRVADPDAILQLRLPPPPLPLSWGKAIKPFRPAVVQTAAAGSSVPADTGAAAAAAAAADATQALVPLGFAARPRALPASRNCSPRIHDHRDSSSSGGRAGRRSRVSTNAGAVQAVLLQTHAACVIICTAQHQTCAAKCSA
jgi:hypothetical protein